MSGWHTVGKFFINQNSDIFQKQAKYYIYKLENHDCYKN